MKLKFSPSFLGAGIHQSLFMINVAREGVSMNKPDHELVTALSTQGIPCQIITQSTAGSKISAGQSCFGAGGWYSVPSNCSKIKLKSAIASLNGLTVDEVAQIWVAANGNIANLINRNSIYEVSASSASMGS